jgi:dienelactone hydrolase
VIAFPGRSGPQKPARFLARHGYGVLLFDRRGESESDGDGNLVGWGGDKDIPAAIEFLKSRPDVDPGRIAGIGLSVGGELMLQAAAETNDLAAVISDGAGTRSFAEELEELHGPSKWLALPMLAVKADPRDRTHGRDHRAPEGVRAPRDRLPRGCPAER